MQFTIYTIITLISWFGAKLIVSGSMSTGQIASLISYTFQILMSLMMLSMIFVMTIISRASAERIDEVLSENSSLSNPENPVYEVTDGSVCFDNVSFSYKNDKNKQARVICDYIAGMSDNFLTMIYSRLFVPNYGSIGDLL